MRNTHLSPKNMFLEEFHAYFMQKENILHDNFSPWPVGLFFLNGLKNMGLHIHWIGPKWLWRVFLVKEQPQSIEATSSACLLRGCYLAKKALHSHWTDPICCHWPLNAVLSSGLTPPVTGLTDQRIICCLHNLCSYWSVSQTCRIIILSQFLTPVPEMLNENKFQWP